MFCRKCGNEINKNARFCRKCGTRNVEEDTDYEESYYIEPQNFTNGLSITGMISGIVAIIFSIILLILVLNEEYYNGKYLLFFVIMGLLSGIFFLVGLILSIIGISKKVNPLGIVGIIVSVLSLFIDIGLVIYVFTSVIN